MKPRDDPIGFLYNLIRRGDFWKWTRAEWNWRIKGDTMKVEFAKEALISMEGLPDEVQLAIEEMVVNLGRNPYSGVREGNGYRSQRLDVEEEEPDVELMISLCGTCWESVLTPEERDTIITEDPNQDWPKCLVCNSDEVVLTIREPPSEKIQAKILEAYGLRIEE